VAQSLYEPSFEHDSCGFGFVCDIAGRPSHGIVRDALTVLVNLEHRGASGSERNTGDGAGVLTQVPFAFLGAVAAEQGLRLPVEPGYGVGMLFLPRDEPSRMACEGQVARVLAAEGLELLGWRDVPTAPDGLGETARTSQPGIRQVFVGRPADAVDDVAFDRRLFVARRLALGASRPGRLLHRVA
jgi:glutamate synthase (ferredoxin)